MSTNLDLILLASKSLSATEALYLQLKDDYPAKAIDWVKDYNWDWPHAVPLDQVDFSNQKEWAASKSHKKVQKFKERITCGLMKPSILVKPKGSDIYMIVDGHNRGLANKELNRPMLAWTTNTDSKNGPWGGMHDAQSHNMPIKASQSNIEVIMLVASLL